MATLPRMQPEHFYDLVVEVAIIRPGPIVGQMVNPYLERRAGREQVTYAHPSLEPMLARTLGVPLFQEQLMRIAMAAAGFTGGEADELRRAMGFKRSHGADEAHRAPAARGDDGERHRRQSAGRDRAGHHLLRAVRLSREPRGVASRCSSTRALSSRSTTRRAFYAAMLNCWPMGFYSPATLVKDAQRRGVRVRPIDAARSDWLCTLERPGPEEELSLRLGLRYARGLREAAGRRLVEERGRQPFASIADLAARVSLRRDELSGLAEIGALASIPARPDGPKPTRRAALWQAEAASRRGPGLFARVEPREDAGSPLPEMDLRDRIAADLRGTGMTVGPHPVALERKKLQALGVHPAGELKGLRRGSRVRTGGLCIVRQRPGTAKGFVFLSLEDETGISNVVIDPQTFEKNRRPILESSLLVVEGRLEKYDGVVSVKGDRFWGLHEALARHVQSRDFR